MHIHDLAGCAPAPLAHYLKALGILRLVAEQADPLARGWWEGDRFRLATSLDQPALLHFFNAAYEPTPVFNPWGGRSGFYVDSSEKAARQSLRALEASEDPRLRRYRAVIGTTRSVIGEISQGGKPRDEDKQRLIRALRMQVRNGGQAWLDAVVAIVASAEGGLQSEFPALFGTGGNEGSGSYTSAFMGAVVDCIVRGRWHHSLPSVLFGEPVPHAESSGSSGQFLPEGVAQAWDLLLAFEGACLLRSAAAKRAGSGVRSLSSPFAVRTAAFGYGSAARLDHFVLKQGNELFGRGEQWFPMWSQPTTVGELGHLLAEGRASNGARAASDGWSMARAVSGLGVRRGISEFIRYGYLQRNNQALHFAVPLGRFKAGDSAHPLVSCFDDVDRWFELVRLQARRKETPSSFRVRAQTLCECMFAALQRPNEPTQWQATLIALQAMERVMRSGTGFKAQPIPPLRPEWATAADDGSPAFRLALSLALQAGAFHPRTGRPIDGIRRHWLPLDDKRPGRFATTGDLAHQRLAMNPGVVMQGRDGVADAIALLERRLVDAAQRGERSLPLRAATRAWAHPADLAAWVAGQVDPDRTLALARALMALDRGLWAEQIVPISRPLADAQAVPDDAFLVLRLAHLSGALPQGQRIPCDAAILRRLAAGDAPAAVAPALRRLSAAGLRCTVRAAAAAPHTARLWAAALAFPIHPRTAQGFARRLDPTFAEEPFA